MPDSECSGGLWCRKNVHKNQKNAFQSAACLNLQGPVWPKFPTSSLTTAKSGHVHVRNVF